MENRTIDRVAGAASVPPTHIGVALATSGLAPCIAAAPIGLRANLAATRAARFAAAPAPSVHHARRHTWALCTLSPQPLVTATFIVCPSSKTASARTPEANPRQPAVQWSLLHITCAPYIPPISSSTSPRALTACHDAAHLDTAAVITCVLKKPPFVRSITC